MCTRPTLCVREDVRVRVEKTSNFTFNSSCPLHAIAQSICFTKHTPSLPAFLPSSLPTCISQHLEWPRTRSIFPFSQHLEWPRTRSIFPFTRIPTSSFLTKQLYTSDILSLNPVPPLARLIKRSKVFHILVVNLAPPVSFWIKRLCIEGILSLHPVSLPLRPRADTCSDHYSSKLARVRSTRAKRYGNRDRGREGRGREVGGGSRIDASG